MYIKFQHDLRGGGIYMIIYTTVVPAKTDSDVMFVYKLIRDL